jgi:DNA-binding response OmpR family regulator
MSRSILTDRRLLIVDDEPVDRWAICALLHSWGCAVQGAGNLQEMNAIRSEWPPEMFVLDIVMPPPDGIDILREIAAARCRTPVLLVSARADRLRPARNLGLTYGVKIAGALRKPLDAATLAAVMRASFRPG